MLKILHTADWHLGHSLHGVSREYEHRCFLDWLLEQINQTAADALIIAGDVFDSANPSANAQSMYYDFLVQAKQQSPELDIVIIGGNHDSASRLDAPEQILHSLGVSVVGGLTRIKGEDEIDWQRLIIPLTDKTGKIQGICGAMPFIRNADLPEIATDDPLVAGVRQLYRQLMLKMQEYKTEQDLDDNIAEVLTGHCYMVGTELSELSERRILGGNQHALPTSIFNSHTDFVSTSYERHVDYVALGHLHKSQRVKSAEDILIHYSGSPLPLSFAEKNYQHRILYLKYEQNKTNLETIKVPRAVEIQVIPETGYATLAELETLISQQAYFEKGSFESTFFESGRDEQDSDEQDNVQTDLSEPKLPEPTLSESKYPMLEVRLELDKPEPDLRQQIETMLSGKLVRLLKITTFYPGKGKSLAETQDMTRLEELHPEDVFQQCYERSFDKQAPESMTALFHQLLESVEVKE